MLKYMKSIAIYLICLSFCLVSVAGADVINKAYWTDASGANLNAASLTVGTEQALTLNAQVPEGQTLKAYTVYITYDPAAVSVDKNGIAAASKSGLAPANINLKEPGVLIINGFNAQGLNGGAVLSIANVTFKGIQVGESACEVNFVAFGSSSDNEFIPEIEPLQIVVR